MYVYKFIKILICVYMYVYIYIHTDSYMYIYDSVYTWLLVATQKLGNHALVGSHTCVCVCVCVCIYL